VVIIIIWAGLVTAFIFNQRRPEAANSATNKTAAAEKASAAATPEPLSATRPPPAAGGQEGKAASTPVPAGQAAANAATSPSAAPPAAVQPAAGKGTAAGRAQVRPASSDSAKAGPRISLVAIQKEFGIYPEVHFGVNSNKLDDNGYEVLSTIARFWLQNPETLIILRGYTDRSGVRAYNLKLSEFRANIVKSYLVGRGIKPESITTMAIGPDEQGPGGTTVPYDGQRRKVVIEIVTPTG